MKHLFLMNLFACGMGLNFIPLISQSRNFQIVLSSDGSDNTAKSVFGLNKIHSKIIGQPLSETDVVRIEYVKCEISFGDENWMIITSDISTCQDCGDFFYRVDDSMLVGSYYFKLYDLFLKDPKILQSFSPRGRSILYRVAYRISSQDRSFDSTYFSMPLVLHIPAPSRQDKEAFSYILQKRDSCGEITIYNDFTSFCMPHYEYMAKKFPKSVWGKIAKYKIAHSICLQYGDEPDQLALRQDEIRKTYAMLSSSEISLLQNLAKYLEPYIDQ